MERECLLREFKTSNLLLAAFLECGGASIARIELKSRFSVVYMDLTELRDSTLADKLNRVVRCVEKVEDDTEWGLLFNACMLGEIEDRYLRLKRRITQERPS